MISFTVAIIAGLSIFVGGCWLGWHIGVDCERGRSNEPPAPLCPHCGDALRRVTVRDLGNPAFPEEAAWVCPGQYHHQPCGRQTRYFADLPAGKPAGGIEEV